MSNPTSNENYRTVIIVDDEYQKEIEELKDAIGNLQNDADMEGNKDRYNRAINVMEHGIWKAFERMCSFKARYTDHEYRAMMNDLTRRQKMAKAE